MKIKVFTPDIYKMNVDLNIIITNFLYHIIFLIRLMYSIYKFVNDHRQYSCLPDFKYLLTLTLLNKLSSA